MRGPVLTWRRGLLGAGALLLAAGAMAYSQKDKYSDDAAELSRQLIGDENTARVESWYFRVHDRVERVKYRVLGGETDPFSTDSVVVSINPAAPAPPPIPYYVTTEKKSPAANNVLLADSLGPVPMTLPTVRQLRESPEAGEGVWTTAGLPRSSPGDVLMAKTFVRPDKARPYALVGLLVMDARRIKLTATGGTAHPGGDRGVKGPGVIPLAVQATLLAAWNGGFQGGHGGFGMYADGKEYRPLRKGLASLVGMKDGTLKMGEWGADVAWEDGIDCVRQNAVLLVKDGEVSKRTAEGNDTWGYVKVDSTEFITWRSAVGLTKDGNLLVAAGNSLSAQSLATALWAAGAHSAMQLDINSPYVLTSLFFQQPDGSLKGERFMDGMPDSPNRFLKTQERDFFYVTLDETRYR